MANTIKVTTYDVSAIKIGTSNVDAVYVGTEKVYPSTSPHDYSLDYLTFVAVESGTFKFSGNSINYSIDSGTTWTELASDTSTPTISAGNSIMWKVSGITPTSTIGIGRFSSTNTFVVQGNTMSLLYGDNFSGQTSLDNTTYTFHNLFSGATGLTSAENMILPATTLTQRCYNQLFYQCTSLTKIPKLPATTLGDTSYGNMFRSCTSLETVPQNMFSAVTTTAVRCFANAFWESGIKNLPTLPNVSLSVQCYSGTFAGCKGLTSIPSNYLTATTLNTNCYYAMFSGCTSINTVPSDLLPATTLSSSCYAQMFCGCTSLVTAPDLPATTLVSSCYNQLFDGCSSLNYIKAMFTRTPSSTYTSNWVRGVASSGTYVKNSSASYTTRGNSAIPNNWTIQTASS